VGSDTKVVSFTSPAGVSYTRKVSDSLDPTVIAGLKVGQRVDVTRTEASSITMQFALAANPPAGAAALRLPRRRPRSNIGSRFHSSTARTIRSMAT
jgi:hypothetical protein